LASLAQLLEMDFQPTLIRNAAYVYAIAQTLNRVGLPDEVCGTGQNNMVLLETLVSFARRIYQIVAFDAALILIVAGTYFSILQWRTFSPITLLSDAQHGIKRDNMVVGQESWINTTMKSQRC